jgi:hypothetical protein
MCQCTIPELLFVLEFHTDTYQYSLYYIHLAFFSIFIKEYPYFAFKKYTGTSKCPFRALVLIVTRRLSLPFRIVLITQILPFF